jgi:hypothetical protein
MAFLQAALAYYASLGVSVLRVMTDNVLYREAGGWRGQQVSDRQFGLAA